MEILSLDKDFRKIWQEFLNKRKLEPDTIRDCLSNKTSNFYGGFVRSLELIAQTLTRIQIETPLGAKYVAILAYAVSLQEKTNSSDGNDNFDEDLKKFAYCHGRGSFGLQHSEVVRKIVDKGIDKPLGYYAGFSEGIRLASLMIPEFEQLSTSEAKTCFSLFAYCVHKIHGIPEPN